MHTIKEKIKNKHSKISQQYHIIQEICENGEMQYNCTACGKTFRSRSQKYYHLTCNQLQKLIYKCEHCEKSFARHSQWKYHIESHSSPVNECSRCQKIFSNPLALKKHVALHMVEPKLCPHCDKTFRKKISLDQHIAAQHLHQLQYGCAYCFKKYASKSTLQLHLQTHEKKRFECTFCGKFFQRNSILNLHLKRHHKSISYVCTVCQKVFSESGTLARHRKIHEENVIQYHCKLCDKSILRKDNMTRHLNTIHPEEKFDNIVEIIKNSVIYSDISSNHTNMDNVNSVKQIINSKNNVVILENKLLHKPLKPKEPTIDVPEIATNKIVNMEYPLINQIKVITAVPNYEKNIYNKTADTKILANPEASFDLQQMQNDFVESYEKNETNNIIRTDCVLYLNNSPNRAEHQVLEYNNNRGYFSQENEISTFGTASIDQHKSIQVCELPNTQTVSSVIRSVGNVKKKLTPPIVTTANHVNQTCMEYKHKKYCRNNYNIDLYRKILGCDDDDNGNEKNKEQLHLQSEENLSDNHVMKSSTAVHWRKSFKNNYETSSS